MSKKKATSARARKDTAARSATRNTDSAPARAPARSSNDPAVRRAAETNDTAQAMPFNAGKSAEYSDSAADIEPVEGQHVPAPELVTGSTLSETTPSDKTGSGAISGEQPDQRTARPRARQLGRTAPHDQPGRADRRQSEFAQGRAARPDAARGLHPPREDHALRSRAHSRAHRPRARLGRARLLRVLRAADRRSRAPRRSAKRASARRCSCASRPSPASAARSTPRATCAASPSSSTRTKATGISSATTSRCSSSRTR